MKNYSNTFWILDLLGGHRYACAGCVAHLLAHQCKKALSRIWAFALYVFPLEIRPWAHYEVRQAGQQTSGMRLPLPQFLCGGWKPKPRSPCLHRKNRAHWAICSLEITTINNFLQSWDPPRRSQIERNAGLLVRPGVYYMCDAAWAPICHEASICSLWCYWESGEFFRRPRGKWDFFFKWNWDSWENGLPGKWGTVYLLGCFVFVSVITESLHLSRLLPNKCLCSVPMLTLSGAFYTSIYFGVWWWSVNSGLLICYTHYTTESHSDSNTSACGTDC